VGTGVEGELETGCPGYDTIIPIDKGTIGTILKEYGPTSKVSSSGNVTKHR
jgi:arylsulfatase